MFLVFSEKRFSLQNSFFVIFFQYLQHREYFFETVNQQNKIKAAFLFM